jgi:Flp pilus assembly pilin Flp
VFVPDHFLGKAKMNRKLSLQNIMSALHPIADSSGAAMVFVLVIAVIGAIVMASIFFTSRLTLKKGGIRREKVGALNIAEAGKETFYAKLLNDENFTLQPNTSVMIFTDELFGNGMYSVRCITASNIDTVTVQARGSEGLNCVKLEIRAAMTPGLMLNFLGNIDGAVTSRYNVDLTGGIVIDGRDYDSTGNYVGNGIYGISTCMNMSQNGTSEVGGQGVAPVDKDGIAAVRSTVCREMAPISAAFGSPEAFLGVPAGSLDQFKTATLEDDFQGIYYVEGDVGPIHLDNARGILIVHNSTSTAELKINSDGNFKGLIICDVMNKINGTFDILGAAVTLGTAKNSEFGNGDATLRYSAQVLSNLVDYCKNVKKGLSELSWKEMECD